MVSRPILGVVIVAFVSAMMGISTQAAVQQVEIVASDDGQGNFPPPPGLNNVINGSFDITVSNGRTGETTSTGILEFSLASLPAGAVITDVAVVVDVNLFTFNITPGGNEFPTILTLFKEEGGDGVVGLDDLDGNDYLLGATTDVTELGETSLSVNGLSLPAFQRLADGGAAYVTVALSLPFSADDGTDVRFESLESSFGADPRLVITYVPEPSVAALMAMGLGCFGLRRSRRGA